MAVGWPVPSSFLTQGQARREGRGRTAVGSSPAALSLTWDGQCPPLRGPLSLFGHPMASQKHSETEPSPFPPPHMVLRLPADTQLKQLIF